MRPTSFIQFLISLKVSYQFDLFEVPISYRFKEKGKENGELYRSIQLGAGRLKVQKQVFTNFSDLDLASRCQKSCLAENQECLGSCDSFSCDFDCGRKLENCIDLCPCFSGCPNGCLDCDNQVCFCENPDEDPDYLEWLL